MSLSRFGFPCVVTLAAGACTDLDSATNLNPEGPPMIRQVRMKEVATDAEAGRVAGGQVHDGRVAALCLAHEVRELWTADRDFGRFAGLRVRNPLVGR